MVLVSFWGLSSKRKGMFFPFSKKTASNKFPGFSPRTLILFSKNF